MGQSPFFQTLRHIIVTLCTISFLLWAGAVVFSGVFSRAQMRQRDRYSGWNATEIADAMALLVALYVLLCYLMMAVSLCGLLGAYLEHFGLSCAFTVACSLVTVWRLADAVVFQNAWAALEIALCVVNLIVMIWFLVQLKRIQNEKIVAADVEATSQQTNAEPSNSRFYCQTTVPESNGQ